MEWGQIMRLELELEGSFQVEVSRESASSINQEISGFINASGLQSQMFLVVGGGLIATGLIDLRGLVSLTDELETLRIMHPKCSIFRHWTQIAVLYSGLQILLESGHGTGLNDFAKDSLSKAHNQCLLSMATPILLV